MGRSTKGKRRAKGRLKYKSYARPTTLLGRTVPKNTFLHRSSEIGHLSSGVMDGAASGVNGTEVIEGLRVVDVVLSNATISVDNSTSNSSIEACQVVKVILSLRT